VVNGHRSAGAALALGDDTPSFADERDSRSERERERFGRMIGHSPCMRAVFETLERAAASDATVLLEGETGTGKEISAEAVHRGSRRRDRPFLVVDCGAIPPQLLESELFGHERGSFTGAVGSRQGVFEAAAGGTVFLDEIGELSIDLQPKLLRVLERREVRRIGTNQHVPVNVRMVAATNRSLREQVAARKFRSDLYYRLAVVEIRLPPLRERREDIPLLAAHFLERLTHELGKDIAGISEGALKILMDCNWPGNVRELENAVERAMVTCRGPNLTEDDFSFLKQESLAGKTWSIPAGMTLQEMEKLLIAATIQRAGGNIKESAAILGIDRSTMYEKIKKYEIPR